MRRHKLSTMALLVVFLVASGHASGESSDDTPASGALVVDTAGSILLVDAEAPTARIATRGRLWDAPGLETLCPSETSRYRGCHVGAAATDPNGRFLYAAVGRDPSARLEGTHDYRLATLRLPDLALLSSIDLAGVSGWSITLLVAPAADELLVSFSRPDVEAGEGRTMPRLLRLPAPALITEGEGLDETEAEGTFSASARWLEGGRFLDRFRVRSDQGEVLSRVNPYEAFGQRAHEAFPDLTGIGARGRPFLSIEFAGAVAERLLYVVNHDGKASADVARSGLVVYDMASEQTWEIRLSERAASGMPMSGATPTVRLTPDGEHIIVEGYELRRPPDWDRDKRFKTGVLHVYEVKSGARLASVSLPQASGYTARVIGFSPDGRVLYYGVRGAEDRRVYLVDIVAGEILAQFDAGSGFDPYSVIAFAPFDRPAREAD